jgi:alkanesulfonate monooxygenase SsuD/methylene tetrahydromethanopterin reductase-like flavin-dependent oxidoreductase (luciferase family)
MRISINITNYSWPDTDLAEHLAHVAAAAERAGVDTVWVADHLLQADPTSTLEEPMLEAYTTLGYLAAATTSVRLGTMVTWANLRPAALTVKAVTTLDVLSHGRAWMGIGAGYQRDEADALGLPFPSTSERFEYLEDTLRLAQHMWSDDLHPFSGARAHAAHPVSRPRPISTPRPQILIGGMGERRTLPLVARYADACNFFDIPDGGRTLARILEVLARECARIRRPRETIETTISSRLEATESADAFVERCRDLTAFGIDHVVLVTTGPWTDQLLDTIAQANERLASA